VGRFGDLTISLFDHPGRWLSALTWLLELFHVREDCGGRFGGLSLFLFRVSGGWLSALTGCSNYFTFVRISGGRWLSALTRLLELFHFRADFGGQMVICPYCLSISLFQISGADGYLPLLADRTISCSCGFRADSGG
jgi:hypothetical protein